MSWGDALKNAQVQFQKLLFGLKGHDSLLLQMRYPSMMHPPKEQHISSSTGPDQPHFVENASYLQLEPSKPEAARGHLAILGTQVCKYRAFVNNRPSDSVPEAVNPAHNDSIPTANMPEKLSAKSCPLAPA